MSDLEVLLGQDRIAAEIVSALGEQDCRIVRLTGRSGAGKSYAALLAGATWRDAGGRVVVATGDEANRNRPIYPFMSGMGTLPRDWRGLASQGSRSALKVADVVIGAGGVSGSIFDLLTSAVRYRSERAVRHLSATEREVVTDLRRMARSKQLLIIADNAHYWDAGSLSLLDEVLSERLRLDLPQLNSVSVLLVDTVDDQTVTAPEQFNRLVESCGRDSWRLDLLELSQFPEVLAGLGLEQPIPEEILETLYGITSGHLKIAEQLVQYANDADLPSIESLGTDGRLTQLLEARLRSLGPRGRDLAVLLSHASVIGTSFERQEIECLLGGASDEIGVLLAGASSIRFVDESSSRLQFSHEILRDHFLGGNDASSLSRIRIQFEQCLAVLRPTDYATRSALLLEAGETKRGRELYALAAIDQLRRRTPKARVIRETAVEFEGDKELVDFLAVIADAYQAIAVGDYRSPLPSLKTPVPSETALMAAERNYLRAICSMELETQAGFLDSRNMLEEWLSEAEAETELGLRYLQLIQQAEVYLERFVEARTVEARIERQLASQTPADVRASVLLQKLNRRSAGVNTPEVSEVRIREAVEFFRRGTGDERLDTLELYRSLNNHTAMLIKLDRNVEAHTAIAEAERIALDHPDIVTRIDVVAGNMVTASVRTGIMDLHKAVSMHRAILNSPEGSGDNFLHRTNLTACLLLSGQDLQARDLLAKLRHEVDTLEISETYLLYYLQTLEVTAALVGGDRSGAAKLHERFEPFVKGLRWANAPYVRRRHELLGEMLDGLDVSSDRELLDRVILDRYPVQVGPGWAYHARMMPFCEMSFWTDS